MNILKTTVFIFDKFKKLEKRMSEFLVLTNIVLVFSFSFAY